MPYHHPKNRPNQPTSQRSRHLPRIRPRPHHSRRPPTYPRHPICDRKNPTKSAPFIRPSTCPSRKKVARNHIPTPFTAHCHPAYQVSMISEDTPPQTKLCVSSVTYRHYLPADHPPPSLHAPITVHGVTYGAFFTIAWSTAVKPLYQPLCAYPSHRPPAQSRPPKSIGSQPHSCGGRSECLVVKRDDLLRRWHDRVIARTPARQRILSHLGLEGVETFPGHSPALSEPRHGKTGIQRGETGD